MSAITAKASRKMKKYAVLTREPRCFLGSFDFSWEQRKVQDVADRFDNLRIPVAANLRVHGTTPYYGANGIQDYVEGFTHDGEFVLVAEDGANDLKNYPVKCVNGRIWVNNHAHVLQGKAGIADNSFLAFAISQSDIESLLVGGGRAKLNAETLMSIEFRLPCLQEQYRIGEYLTQLDHLITLHQRKCVFLFGFFQAFISMILTASTFSWEQRKFGEVFDCTVPNNTLSRAELSYDEGTVLNVHYGDVLIKYDSVLDVQKDDIPRIPHRCREDFNGALLQDGDVIIADTAEDETTGKACEIGNLQGSAIVSGLHTMVCRPRNRMALGYLGYYLNSNAYHHQLLPLMQGIKVLSLSRSNIQKTSVSYPSAMKEQQLIASYFSQLDHLITLHQRECISFTARAGGLILTANKKRNTSSWEQRKLGEMGQTYTGLSGKTKDDFGHGQARFVTYMNVFSNPISNPEMTEPIEIDPKQNEVEVGDVFFTTSSETPEEVGMSSILLEKRGKTYLNSFCFGFRPSEKIDSYYLAYMLRSESTRAKIILLAQGISRYNISKNKVMEIAVSLPSLDEQKMIGQYFSQLDNLITLHQRKPFLMKWRTSDANRNQTNRLVL